MQGHVDAFEPLTGTHRLVGARGDFGFRVLADFTEHLVFPRVRAVPEQGRDLPNRKRRGTDNLDNAASMVATKEEEEAEEDLEDLEDLEEAGDDGLAGRHAKRLKLPVTSSSARASRLEASSPPPRRSPRGSPQGEE